MASEYENSCRELIALKGNKIGMNSDICLQWHKDEHDTCHGCPCELGCTQLIGLLLAGMDIDPCRKVDTIIDTKDPEVIRKIDFHFAEYDILSQN